MKTYGESGTDYSLNSLMETRDHSAFVFTGYKFIGKAKRVLIGKIDTDGEVLEVVAT